MGENDASPVGEACARHGTLGCAWCIPGPFTEEPRTNGKTILWADIGPVSQGKILTAILQGRDSVAKEMLHRWGYKDLGILWRAADKLAGYCEQEQKKRRDDY